MMTPAPNVPNGPAPVSSPVRTAAYIVAVVFLIVGALGFVPGVTSSYGDMEFAGPDSDAMLFGIFAVSVLHNLVHLFFGVVGLIMARGRRLARVYLFVGGLIYLAVFIYGVVVDHAADENILALNNADNWLHLGLAVCMLLFGFLQRTPEGTPSG